MGASTGRGGYDADGGIHGTTAADGRAAVAAVYGTVVHRLRLLAGIVLVGWLATFYLLRLAVWPRLEADLLASGASVVAVTPFDVVLLQAKLGLIVGLLAALPVALYLARRSLVDRLDLRVRRVSRRTLGGIAVLAALLFCGGVAYAYVLVLPVLFEFLSRNAIQAGFAPTYSIVEWTQFVILLSIAMGFAAELPLAMTALVYGGVVSHATLRSRWRHAVVGIVLVGSIVNGSPDPISMVMIAAPMLVLFGVGLLCTRLVDSLRRSRGAASTHAGAVGDPAGLDLGALDAAGVRAAPAEAFAGMRESAVTAHAEAALAAGDAEKARALFDRYDGVGGKPTADEPPDDSDGADDAESAAGIDGVVGRTAAGMVGAFADDGTTTDDVGGYFYDLRFVVESLRSRSFRVLAGGLLAAVATFGALYYGGVGLLKRDFLARLPASVRPSDVDIVLLHPVEILVFETKVSVIAGFLVVVPLLAYYAWPAMAARGLVRSERPRPGRWGGALVGGFLAGSALGYAYVAPTVVSWLVADAVQAEMVVAYRAPGFLWLVLYTTVGVGLLADVPVAMLLADRAGIVRYRAMRRHWRVAVVFALCVGALLPQGVFSMLLLGLPVAAAYGVGLAALSAIHAARRLMPRGSGRSRIRDRQSRRS